MMISPVPVSVKYEPINLPLPSQQQNRSLKAAERKRQVTIITENKIKRRRDVEEVKPADVYNAKRIRTENSSTDNVDVFTNLPECLKLHILSLLDAKSAVRTSLLSKTWKPLWTSLPTLNFTSYDKAGSKLGIFDKFVHQSLSNRHPVNLDRLTFTRGGVSSAKILETVFSYALSHNVKELESWIKDSRNESWPNCLKNSSNSLKSLKLRSHNIVSCPLLEPQAGLFKNLAILNLTKTIISDSQPFSRFPSLEKLTLIDCPIKETEGNTLNIHALKLLELEISCSESIDRLELATPNLKLFQFRARNFPQLDAPHGLPVLQTVVIDYDDVGSDKHEKKKFEDLIRLFSKVNETKSLRIFPAVIELLTLYKDELVNPPCYPFKDLDLKVDHSQRYTNRPKERPCAEITDYLLNNCNDVKKYIFVKPIECANCKPFCECVEEEVVVC
ncbi:putative F-box/FBD/LRR-repeat protein At4g03220 [Rutidosis leptorrhynchoides]|uniref:putative F-box/FBD/LRR-repeat protein At4g03220 n=1 Tax=Rutidosis leptorrhynchoides TaxID=125765 RepID=UPI003A9A332D